MIEESIITKIERYLRENNLSLNRLGKLTGTNRGGWSTVLGENPTKVISLNQVDIITKAMGLAPGSLYMDYIQECTKDIHWKRVRPFIMSCAELNRIDCIEKLLPVLVENTNHLPWIFTTAEMLYAEKYMTAAALLYQQITEVERQRFSDRLAMSYYRLMKIHFDDPWKGFEAALQFIPYRKQLPESYGLDGLLTLADVYAIRNEWNVVENYADELRELASALYDNRHLLEDDFKPERPLVYYYAQGFLYKAVSLERQRNYTESLKWTEGYSDLSWFEGLDENGRKEVERFKMFAQANRQLCMVCMGDRNSIAPYMDFIKKHPSEIVEGLTALIDTALRYQFSIDQELNMFADYISRLKDSPLNGADQEISYREQNQIARIARFYNKYAKYCFRNKCYNEGINNLLCSLKLSVRIGKNDGTVSETMSFFVLNRDYSTPEQEAEFAKICTEVISREADYDSIVV